MLAADLRTPRRAGPLPGALRQVSRPKPASTMPANSPVSRCRSRRRPTLPVPRRRSPADPGTGRATRPIKDCNGSAMTVNTGSPSASVTQVRGVAAAENFNWAAYVFYAARVPAIDVGCPADIRENPSASSRPCGSVWQAIAIIRSAARPTAGSTASSRWIFLTSGAPSRPTTWPGVPGGTRPGGRRTPRSCAW